MTSNLRAIRTLRLETTQKMANMCEEHPLDVSIDEEPLVRNIRMHDLLLTFSIIFTGLACTLSGFQIFRHATNYTAPKAQRQIIRILFMVPVFGICCTLSVEFYSQHVYISAVYEFYEALVIAAFFLLLCQYLHLDMASLRQVFTLVEPMKWIRPLRIWHKCFGRGKGGKTVDGLKWFNIIWFGVFQFVLIKFFAAIVKCITEAFDVYCSDSNSVKHANVWIGIIETVSLVTAMMFLIQFYKQTKTTLKEHSPLLKFIAIKLVIFLFYFQTFIFDKLTAEDGLIEPSDRISYPSWSTGIPNALLCFEMFLVSILHLWAYPSRPYRKTSTQKTGDSPEELQHMTSDYVGYQPHDPYQGPDQGPTSYSLAPDAMHNTMVKHGGYMGWKALVDAVNFYDIIRSIATGFYWLFMGRRQTVYNHELDEHSQSGEARRTENLSEALNAI